MIVNALKFLGHVLLVIVTTAAFLGAGHLLMCRAWEEDRAGNPTPVEVTPDGETDS